MQLKIRIEIYIGTQKSALTPDGQQYYDYLKNTKVFEVSAESVFSKNPEEKIASDGLSFNKKETKIKAQDLAQMLSLVLITEIQVYKQFRINLNQSGLTTPIILDPLTNDSKEDISIETQYLLSAEPKLECRVKRLQGAT